MSVSHKWQEPEGKFLYRQFSGRNGQNKGNASRHTRTAKTDYITFTFIDTDDQVTETILLMVKVMVEIEESLDKDYIVVGLHQSWLTMDDDNPSITCPGCLLSLSSASCGCRDKCESGNLGCIGHICVLSLVCWLSFPFSGSLLCCHHCQLLFTGLQLFVKHASPAGEVSSKVLPGINVDVECLHVSLAHILVPQLWVASASLP